MNEATEQALRALVRLLARQAAREFVENASDRFSRDQEDTAGFSKRLTSAPADAARVRTR